MDWRKLVASRAKWLTARSAYRKRTREEEQAEQRKALERSVREAMAWFQRGKVIDRKLETYRLKCLQEQ